MISESLDRSIVSLFGTSDDCVSSGVLFFISVLLTKLDKYKSHAVSGDLVGHCARVGVLVKLLLNIFLWLIRKVNICLVK